MTFANLGAGYAEQLSRGLRLTGEEPSYFARKRIDRVREIATAAQVRPRVVLDFGSGSGTAFPSLRAAFADARIVGFEPERSLRAVAVDAAMRSKVELPDADTLDLMGEADIVYCSGVFHHIPVADRGNAMRSLCAALRPGGIAFVWENSPYNLGTRLIMSRIPFDRDAQLLRPSELRSLQQSSGLVHHTTEYHFVFPRLLAFLRPTERLVRTLPLGGQYLVAGRAQQ